MTIPTYNLNQTTEAVLNRAKGRVIKKLSKKFSQDVLLQDIDITQGNANTKALELIGELDKIKSLLDKILILSSNKVLRVRTRNLGRVVNKYEFKDNGSFVSFVDALTQLDLIANKVKISLEQLLTNINYVENENIRNINKLLEDIKNLASQTGFYQTANMTFTINGQMITVNQKSNIIGLMTNIGSIINNMNNTIDIAIQNYNDKTTKSNLQRLTPVDALDKEPKLKLKGGRRSYSLSESPLASVYI